MSAKAERLHLRVDAEQKALLEGARRPAGARHAAVSSGFSRVEPLSAAHVVAGFDGGSPAPSVWRVEHAPRAYRAGLSRVYVVCDTDLSDGRVVGYYALAAGSVATADASPRLRQG